jgi:hypothetical protein
MGEQSGCVIKLGIKITLRTRKYGVKYEDMFKVSLSSRLEYYTAYRRNSSDRLNYKFNIGLD